MPPARNKKKRVSKKEEEELLKLYQFKMVRQLDASQSKFIGEISKSILFFFFLILSLQMNPLFQSTTGRVG